MQTNADTAPYKPLKIDYWQSTIDYCYRRLPAPSLVGKIILYQWFNLLRPLPVPLPLPVVAWGHECRNAMKETMYFIAKEWQNFLSMIYFNYDEANETIRN